MKFDNSKPQLFYIAHYRTDNDLILIYPDGNCERIREEGEWRPTFLVFTHEELQSDETSYEFIGYI